MKEAQTFEQFNQDSADSVSGFGGNEILNPVHHNEILACLRKLSNILAF
ncbi:hypothetical protein [Helicobacter pylori]|nr:hypothetical protein [Helicobacter pylori]